MIIKNNAEFGVELALSVPYAYWLHKYNELDDDDEGWEDAAIEEDVRREIAKGAQSFYQGILDGTITKDTFGRFE